MQRKNCEFQQKIIASTVERRNNANSLLIVNPLEQQQKRIDNEDEMGGQNERVARVRGAKGKQTTEEWRKVPIAVPQQRVRHDRVDEIISMFGDESVPPPYHSFLD